MNYAYSEDAIIIRRELRNGWSSHVFIPINQRPYFVMPKTSKGKWAIYVFPTDKEMYWNTKQVSYPKSE
ncbi:MAG: hypothetical protein QXT19_03785 [Candidatus Woesearchaeota archaeon]